MLEITRNNRDEIEKEFLALVLHKPQIIETTHILPKYLHIEDHRKIYEEFVKCYRKYKVVTKTMVDNNFQGINIMTFNDLLEDTLYYEQAWEYQLKLSEESIIKFYKEDILDGLNEQLKSRKIAYGEFVNKVKDLDSIKISTSDTAMLTVDSINQEEEEYTYIKSGINGFDEKIKGFALGQLSVWSGGNASAKSTFLNQLAIESINQEYNVAIYSGELTSNRLLKWITMQCAGKRNMKFNDSKKYWYVDNEAKKKITNWLSKKLYIYNNANGNKVGDILGSIEEYIKSKNIKVIILDNLMSIDLNSYGDNKYDTQSQLIKDLSSLAKKYDVHIHFVCHPRKSTSFLRKTDISGTSDLTNIADNVFILHRNNQDFKSETKEFFKWPENSQNYQYTNLIEICKNRDFGVEDCFIGMYFEPESRRLLNSENEFKYYKWQMTP